MVINNYNEASFNYFLDKLDAFDNEEINKQQFIDLMENYFKKY